MSGALVTLIGLAIAVVALVLWARRDLAYDLTTSYAHGHRRFRTLGSKIALAVGAILLISMPIGFSWIGMGDLHLPRELIPGLPLNEKWIIVGINAATYTIGALGMNLLIGNTGQVSLGHSGFIALGAYSIGYFGTDLTIGGKHIPSWLWVVIAGILGAILSAAIGPFALRLRGNYLAMVSLLLVFGADHVIKNWESFTGGDVAPRNDLPGFTLTLFPGKPIRFRDSGEVSVFDVFFAPEGTSWVNRYYFWLCWAFAILGIIVARNILRSRQGRAMMAVRDRDLSAEVIGVRQMYTKTGAFAVSGAYAAVAGSLLASHLGSVQPANFALGFSIQFIAMIVIGGVGSVLGSVLGAISIAAIFDVIKASQPILENLPFIQLDPSKRGLTLDLLSVLLYGLLIVVFLIYFPTGLAGLWQRIRRYFAAWPFRS